MPPKQFKTLPKSQIPSGIIDVLVISISVIPSCCSLRFIPEGKKPASRQCFCLTIFHSSLLFIYFRNIFLSLSQTHHLGKHSKKPSTMSTTPKKPDPNTGSQGAPLASKAPNSNDNANPRYEVVERGQLHTLNYRCYFRDTQTKSIVSPFHDIPLVNEQYSSSKENQTETIYNMVVEVPRWTNAKMEINKQLKLNPLTQDVKNGKPRFVHNVFPYHGYLWNYGALPQTWEDPNHVDEDTKTTGDNDPVDVCEIGTTLHATGSIVPVKIVGVLGLIDEGETDWKLIGIDIRDKLASQVFAFIGNNQPFFSIGIDS